MSQFNNRERHRFNRELLLLKGNSVFAAKKTGSASCDCPKCRNANNFKTFDERLDLVKTQSDLLAKYNQDGALNAEDTWKLWTSFPSDKYLTITSNSTYRLALSWRRFLKSIPEDRLAALNLTDYYQKLDAAVKKYSSDDSTDTNIFSNDEITAEDIEDYITSSVEKWNKNKLAGYETDRLMTIMGLAICLISLVAAILLPILFSHALFVKFNDSLAIPWCFLVGIGGVVPMPAYWLLTTKPESYTSDVKKHHMKLTSALKNEFPNTLFKSQEYNKEDGNEFPNTLFKSQEYYTEDGIEMTSIDSEQSSRYK